MHDTREELQCVLIVDDDPTNIRVIGQQLKSDYQVKATTRGMDALEICQSDNRPDLILLDVQLPDVDGYTLCRLLKSDEKSCGIPIIFLTAQDDNKEEAYGLSLGAVDYIRKPFDVRLVQARVHIHLELKKKTDLLEKLASIDGLTEIPNRRYFDDQLNQEWNQTEKPRTPLSLIMADIDHFKAFNDNYGHSAGDTCLKKVAKAISKVPRRSEDKVFRFGGEEFAIFLPGTPLAGALSLAEKIRLAVFDLQIPHAFSSVSNVVSLSLGVACWTGDSNEEQEVLINQADEHLYRAKEQGRNCCYPCEY